MRSGLQPLTRLATSRVGEVLTSEEKSPMTAMRAINWRCSNVSITARWQEACAQRRRAMERRKFTLSLPFVTSKRLTHLAHIKASWPREGLDSWRSGERAAHHPGKAARWSGKAPDP